MVTPINKRMLRITRPQNKDCLQQCKMSRPVQKLPLMEAEVETVATFVSKLWKIVEKREHDKLISWSETGKTFVVKDYNTFSKKVLPYYFKHSNFNSFVRQLNLYGFHKVAKPEYRTLTTSLTDDPPLEFWHTNFRRGHPELLHLVQRRSTPQLQQGTKHKVSHKGNGGGGGVTGKELEPSPHRLSVVMSDINLMKGRQEGIATILETLKQDNQHLRHEIGVLKDKHIRQQKVLNKIIHFLVHMVYKGNIPANARRPSRPSGNRLMLMGSEPKKIRIDDDLIDEFSFGELPSPITDSTIPPSFSSVPSSAPLIVTSPVDSIPSVASSSPSYFPPSLSPQPPPSSVSSELSSAPLTPPSADFTVTSPVKEPTTTTTTSDDPTSINIEDMQFPMIPEGLLYEYPIPPAPTSLVSVPHPENRMCLNGQLNHQQLGLDNLPDVLSNHLSVDPNLISDYVLSDHPLPDYDFSDTARLLESLTGSEDTVSHESMLNIGALVPIQGNDDPVLPGREVSPSPHQFSPNPAQV